MLRAEKILRGIFTKISSFATQQEISDAIKVLETATLDIDAPFIKMNELRPPSTNTNRKGRKSKRGVKSSTERLKIAKENFDEHQKKEIKKKEKKEKEEGEFREKRKLLEIEERQAGIKKIKLTLFVGSEAVAAKNKDPFENKLAKVEKVSSPYDR